MSLDYLPIQASSVPCERVFSSSAETDTKKRNRISPLLMEALQMLKFALKQDRLDFTSGWITSEGEMKDNNDPVEENLLDAMFRGHHDQDIMDRIIQTISRGDNDG